MHAKCLRAKLYSMHKLGAFLFLTISLFTILPPHRAADFVPPPANLVVGSGPGNVRTIREAIAIAVQKRVYWRRRFVIKVTAGIYNESVFVDNRLPRLTLLGEGKGVTIISGNMSVNGVGGSTFDTATFGVDANGFIAIGITFRNTAGPDSGQAVALRVSADRAVFYECSIEGYQDTLYVYDGRQFFKNCDIYGTIDFIFGNAKAFFQDCNIYARYPGHDGAVVITASKREGPTEETGIVVQSSRVTPDPASNLWGTVGYLGRPWGSYSRVVFMETMMDSFIDPSGWSFWDGKQPSVQSSVYYAEYGNTGPGSGTARRVKWGGVHQLTTPAEAMPFTVGVFIDGDSWLPATGVPYKSGL